MSVMSIRCTYSLTEAMSTKTLVDEICADSCSHIYAEAALIKNKDKNKIEIKRINLGIQMAQPSSLFVWCLLASHSVCKRFIIHGGLDGSLRRQGSEWTISTEFQPLRSKIWRRKQAVNKQADLPPDQELGKGMLNCVVSWGGRGGDACQELGGEDVPAWIHTQTPL